MSKTQSVFGVLIAISLFSNSLLAELPGWYPKNYELVGIVGPVSNRIIYVGDNRILLSPTVRFATPKNSNASISLLKKGQTVGVKSILINNRRLVDRIWLIPEGEY